MAGKGGFFRDVVLRFDKAAGERMQQEAQDALERAGKLGANALEEAMKEGGAKAGRALSSALSREYDQLIADAKVKLAKGLISPDEFKKIEQAANRTFNQKLVEGMERLKAEGKLTDAQFAALSRRLKRVGDDGAQDVGRVGSALETLKGKALAIGSAFVAMFALDRMRAFAAETVRAFVGIETSQLRLRAMVEANGGAVERSAAQLAAFSLSLQKETLAQADEIELAMAQLLSYHSISGATFERTLRLGVDLSAVFGGVTSSTEALARALDDPVQGLAMLAKRGFTFAESTKAQIAALVENNRLLEAQDIILKDLESQVGGVAGKMKTGMVGALDDVAKSWLGLKEEIGRTLVSMTSADVGALSLGERLRWLTAHVGDIAVAVVALGKALLVLAGAQGLRMLIGALGTATASLAAFRVALVAAMPQAAVIGALIGLTELFRRSGQEAADAARKVDEFRQSLDGLKDMSLSMALGKRSEIQFRIDMAADLDRQIAEIGDRMKQGGAGAVTKDDRDRLTTLQRLRAEIGSVDELRKHLAAYNEQIEVLKKKAPDLAEIAAENVDNLAREVEQIKQVRDLRALTAAEASRLEAAEQALREAVARGGLTREQEIKALSVLRKERAGLKEELKDEKRLRDELDRREERAGAQGRLYNTNAPATGLAGASVIEGRRKGGGSRMGSTLDTTLIGARAYGALHRGLDNEAMGAFESGFRSMMQNVEQVSADAAHNIASSFQDAFALMLKEGASVGTFFESIGRAMAGSLLGGLAQYATGKVKENIAAAIEMAAKALGFSSLGNVPSAGAAWSSAAQHTAAAAAWGALAGGAGAGRGAVTGGQGAIPQNVRDVGLSTYERAEKKSHEVHVYINPLDPSNPVYQRNVYAATQMAKDRFGENANVTVHPYAGSAP